MSKSTKGPIRLWSGPVQSKQFSQILLVFVHKLEFLFPPVSCVIHICWMWGYVNTVGEVFLLNLKVLECQVVFRVSPCFTCFSWHCESGPIMFLLKFIPLEYVEGEGTKLLSRSCSSGESQQCQS